MIRLDTKFHPLNPPPPHTLGLPFPPRLSWCPYLSMSALFLLQLSSLAPIQDTPQQALISEAVKQCIESQCDKLIMLIRFEQAISNVDANWGQFQALLCSLYVTQLQASYAMEKPLFDFTVVFESWAGYSVGLRPDLKMVFATTTQGT